jgi:hypothetical protein
VELTKKPITASKLRENIYRIVDEVLKTGIPVEIERRGQRLQISPINPGNKLDRLIERPYLKVDPEEIVHTDWSNEWGADDLS